MSPSWWNDTIGVNPMEYVNAGAADDIGDNLDNGLRWLAADWQGKTGDAAVYYFDYAGKALHSHADVFRVPHDKYVDIARDVWPGSLCWPPRRSPGPGSVPASPGVSRPGSARRS
jgi:hypothetical protein